MDLRLRQVKGRRRYSFTAPSGRVYPMPGPGNIIEAASQEDFEWLLTIAAGKG